jgi:hypothetical protein
VWSWEFNGRHDLRKALEEYTDHLDGTLTRRYGPPDGGDEEKLAVQEANAAKRRAEIDRCMEVLEQACPFLWRILDLHYRRGCSLSLQGWTIPAARMGLRKATCPPLVRCVLNSRDPEQEDRRQQLLDCDKAVAQACGADRDLFRVELSLAIGRLFAIHQARVATGACFPKGALQEATAGGRND